jgi:hypothetical protein
MKTGIITEIVDFKVIPNTSNEKVVEIVDFVEKELHFKQSGFLNTELVKRDENDRWLMIHHYESLKEIKEAGKNMANGELLKEFAKIIDMSSVKILLLEQIQVWTNK